MLREREQQIKCKNTRKDLVKRQEEEYLLAQAEAKDRAILKELEEAREKYKEARDVRRYQVEQ